MKNILLIAVSFITLAGVAFGISSIQNKKAGGVETYFDKTSDEQAAMIRQIQNDCFAQKGEYCTKIGVEKVIGTEPQTKTYTRVRYNSVILPGGIKTFETIFYYPNEMRIYHENNPIPEIISTKSATST